jgi:hypothetical protein
VAVLVADQEAVRERPARVGGDLGDALGRVRERGHVDELRVRAADELVGAPADDLLAAVRIERVPAVAVHLEDEVGRRLDQRAVAQLRFPQLAFEALTLADVADRALAADEPAVLEHADRGQVRRDAGPVLAPHDEPELERAAGRVVERRPGLGRGAHRLLGHDEGACWPIISSAV